jgi:hypothetical protein
MRHLSLNRNVFGHHRRLRVASGYGDEKVPLQKTKFLDSWDIIGTKD